MGRLTMYFEGEKGEGMRIILKQEIYRIKNGFAAHSPELRLTAHGHSPELAKANLERTALLFFKPFARQGTLAEEIRSLGIQNEEDGLGLTVATAD
jgi:hypothetical protein